MRAYQWMRFKDQHESLYSHHVSGNNYTDPVVEGWVMPHPSGTWFARTNDGEIKEYFPTHEEAKEFLWGICHMRR